jgi:Flp pilus assembly protein TadG
MVCAAVGRIRQAREHIGVRSGDDAGNAILEFVVLSAFLMVPLVYVIIAVLQVQGSAYGVTEAAREAGRAFVEARSTDAGYRQACTAATIALQNQLPGAFDCASLRVSCVSETGCATTELVPGETIRVAIDIDVGLPFMPTSVFGQPLTIRLHALHDEIVDSFRPQR